MNIAGSLTYDTKMDTKGIDSGLDKIDKKSSGLADSMKIAIGNIISNLANLAAQGLKEIGKAGIDYNAQIEKYQTALETLTGSADKANKIIEQIKKDAASTPFDVKGLVEANQLLISAGVESDRAREDILNLGNAISATGGGNEELSRMAVNLQQIKNVGKASSLDIKQFAYAGIDVYGLLADSMGITREEASKMEVTYDDLTEALKKAANDGGKYAGAMESQSKTFNGQVSNLKDNLNQFIGDTMKPLFDLLKNDILPVVNELIQGGGDTEQLLTDLGNKILDFIFNSINKLLDMLPQMLDIGIKIIVSLIQGITKQAPTLIPKIMEVLTILIETIIDNLDLIIDTGIDLIMALVDGLTDAGAIKMLIEKAPMIVSKLVDALVKALPKLQSVGPKVMGKLGSALIDNLPALLKATGKIIVELLKGFLRLPGEFLKIGKELISGLWSGISSKWNSLKKKVSNFANSVKDKFKQVFKIGSPSKLFRDEIGKWIPEGIAVGIEANTDSVDSAIDKLNDEMLDKMTQAVNVETGKMAYSGTNGTITQMLSAFGTTTVVNDNKLYLDGDQIYENQQIVSAKKNLQTQFGGGYSVSS